MVGCLSVELHKFPEEVWCMPYRDAMLLWRQFETAPPTRILFAQFVGYKNPHKKFTGKIEANDFMRMQKIMGPSAPMPAHLKDAIKWAEGMKKKHPGLASSIQ
jgi:hypothetical protein